MDTSSPTIIEPVSTPKALPHSKRQRRTPEDKRKIIEETLTPGASVARVARAHGVNANQVFQWRRLYEAGKLGNAITAAARLLPVSVSEAAANEAPLMPGTEATASAAITSGVPAISGEPGNSSGSGSIHLELRKARIRIEGHADPAVLKLVLKALLG